GAQARRRRAEAPGGGEPPAAHLPLLAPGVGGEGPPGPDRPDADRPAPVGLRPPIPRSRSHRVVLRPDRSIHGTAAPVARRVPSSAAAWQATDARARPLPRG